MFAIKHLHTLKKPEQNKADHGSDALTSQLQHKPAGWKLEKLFLHSAASLQRGIPIELCSSKAGGISCKEKAEGQGNREAWGVGAETWFGLGTGAEQEDDCKSHFQLQGWGGITSSRQARRGPGRRG